ncbi:hypothetical protein EMCRGX_G020575 [Ephydatia muelleri]
MVTNGKRAVLTASPATNTSWVCKKLLVGSMRIRLKRVAFVSVFSLAGLLFVFYRLQKSVNVAVVRSQVVSTEHYYAQCSLNTAVNNSAFNSYIAFIRKFIPAPKDFNKNYRNPCWYAKLTLPESVQKTFRKTPVVRSPLFSDKTASSVVNSILQSYNIQNSSKTSAKHLRLSLKRGLYVMYEGQVVWELNMQLSNATRIHATIQRKETEDAENSASEITLNAAIQVKVEWSLELLQFVVTYTVLKKEDVVKTIKDVVQKQQRQMQRGDLLYLSHLPKQEGFSGYADQLMTHLMRDILIQESRSKRK